MSQAPLGIMSVGGAANKNPVALCNRRKRLACIAALDGFSPLVVT